MENLAIIRSPGFGMRDANAPILWFETYTSESTGALQVFHGDDIFYVIQQAGVYDVKHLDGKPCWVHVEGGSMKFVRMWKAEA